LRELIGERDLAQISIADVTKRAGVNRSTFYEHYSSVHDLAAAACTAMFDELIATTQTLPLDHEPHGRPAGDPLAGVFAHVASHAGLYKALLGADGSAWVINHLLQRMTIATHANLDLARTGRPAAAEVSGMPDDPLAVFIAGAVLGTVTEWVRRDCPTTPEQIAAVLRPSLISVAATALTEPPVKPD
jgi:AcrR family transcriptional regulator